MTEKKTSKPKWSTLEFYEKSWAILWKHKKLWVLGLAAMIFTTSGNNNFDFSKLDRFDSAKTQEELQMQLPEAEESFGSEDIEESFKNISSDFLENSPFNEVRPPDLAELAELKPVFEKIGLSLESVPTHIYFVLATEIFIILAFFVTLSFIANAWAEAALMKAVSQAHIEDKVSLTSASQYAVSKIKSYLWVKYIPLLKFLLLALLAFLIATPLFILISPSLGGMASVLAALIFTVGAIVVLYLGIRLMIRVLYAKWHCVVDNLPGSESFALATKTADGNMRKTFLLTIVNGILGAISAIVYFIPMLVIGLLSAFLLIYSGFLDNYSLKDGWLIVPFLLIFGLAVSAIFALWSAIMQVFFASVWYLAFKAIRKN